MPKMLHIRNVVRITDYLMLSFLTLATGCLADEKVQTGDNHSEVLSKFSSRHLLDYWDDQNKNFRGSYGQTSSEKAFYILACIFVFAISLICRFCIKYGCTDLDNDRAQSGTVLHAPPRTAGLHPPPSSYGSNPGLLVHSSNQGRASSGSSLPPPRTSRSIILPYEGETFPAHLYGIDNPNYQPTNFNQEQYSNVITIPEVPRQNQTPLCDIMDLPPSYETVTKENFKYPKPTGTN